MRSTFKDQTCPHCGSTDLTHLAEWYGGVIPAGISGLIGCRQCLYWEQLLSVETAETVFDGEKWVVIEAGQGAYRTEAERQATLTYRDPEADNYPRFGVSGG